MTSRIGFLAFAFWIIGCLAGSSASTPRQIITAAILEEDDAKKSALIASLSGDASPEIPRLIGAWKEDAIYLYKTTDDKTIPVQLSEEKDADGKQAAFLLEDGSPLKDSAGQSLRTRLEHTLSQHVDLYAELLAPQFAHGKF